MQEIAQSWIYRFHYKKVQLSTELEVPVTEFYFQKSQTDESAPRRCEQSKMTALSPRSAHTSSLLPPAPICSSSRPTFLKFIQEMLKILA